MSEFSAIGAAGSHGFALRPAPTARAPAVASTAKADLGQSNNNATGQRPNGASVVSVKSNPDAPTGPPPAFQASLLEVESNLQTMIKRMDAEREHSRELKASEEKQAKLDPPPLETEKAADSANGLSRPARPNNLQAIREGLGG